MSERILVEDCNIVDELAEFLGVQPIKGKGDAYRITTDTAIRGKDVAPHYIGTNPTLTYVGPRIEESLADICARADACLVSTDSGSYLRDLGVSTADLVGRLRHRATLMRQRADEFDQMADLHEGASYQSVRSSIERHDELSQEIEALLKRHAHVNPTAVRNGS